MSREHLTSYIQLRLNFIVAYFITLKLFELNSVKKGEKTCSRMQPGQMAHD